MRTPTLRRRDNAPRSTGTATLTTRGVRGAVALLTTGTLVLTACGGDSGDGGEAESGSGAAGDGVLTLALENTPSGWDWRKQITAAHSGLVWRPVYDTLLRTRVDGIVEPNAAEDFSYNEDKTVLTLTLREGMTFTDGAPVDAEAAKFALENFRDGGGPDSPRLTGVTVDVVDDLTLTVTLPRPDPAFTSFLGGAPGALVSPATLESPTLDTEPIGSGPYTLNVDETVTASSLVFERNPDYWNPDDFPHDEVEILVMADETAQLNSLASGQIDGAEINLGSIGRAESSGLHVESFPNVWSGLMLLDRAGTMVPALGDVRVRQAINMVFDREAIAASIWNGNGLANPQVFGPTTSGYQEDLLDYYDYDVEGAKQLMNEAGYADGFDIMLPDIGGYTDEYTAITVQQLALLNIRAQVVPVPRTESTARILKGEFPIFAWKMSVSPEVGLVSNLLTPNGSYNPFNSEDPELNELLAEWSVADQDETAEIYQQINEFVLENAWFAPFGNPAVLWAFNETTTISGTLGSTPPLFEFE
jgi:peptide/nickel transport system substrate-binding protein